MVYYKKIQGEKMNKFLVYCILGVVFLFSGCREPECTDKMINGCLDEYKDCLLDAIENSLPYSYCLDVLCDCMEEHNCENTCQYEQWCVKPFT